MNSLLVLLCDGLVYLHGYCPAFCDAPQCSYHSSCLLHPAMLAQHKPKLFSLIHIFFYLFTLPCYTLQYFLNHLVTCTHIYTFTFNYWTCNTIIKLISQFSLSTKGCHRQMQQSVFSIQFCIVSAYQYSNVMRKPSLTLFTRLHQYTD